MKLKLHSFLFALAVGFTITATAQEETHFNCGQNQMNRELWAKHPQMKADYEQLIANSRQITSDGINQKTTYIIPIVFHIVHEYGSENISDAQVYDQVAVLNRDYRKLNSDINLIHPSFDTIAGDANIEFRLATIDPSGNCTNGIEHIYSHETNIGDDFSKFNQWKRSNYLNIWVVKTMRNGVAGYAYYPTATEGGFFFADGIIILNQYIGRIGSGDEFRSRALTHEIGHYLGLAHPWGSTNDPMVACGDDGIPDTPITKGFNFCPTTEAQAIVCDENGVIVENFQNYMDYSYCSYMFTKDQITSMRNVLQVATASRMNLWQDTNLMVTGALANPAPICAPIADFAPNKRFVCIGAPVVFKDASWNAVIDSREWTFQDGTPSTSTSASQSVTFNSPGWKTVTLKVTNATGTDEMITQKSVFISPQWADYSGTYSEDFNGQYPWNWVVDNPEENWGRFEIANGGVNNSKAFKLNNFKDVSSAAPYTDESVYYNRLGGTKDKLISPSFDLRYTTGATLSFDYAYATNATTIEEMTEELNVFFSQDCGSTLGFTQKKLTGTALVTGGNSADIDFVPSANQWKTVTIPINTSALYGKTRVIFEFKASDNSNNLYIDNFNISGTVGIEENPLFSMDLNVYPNPTNANEGINIDYHANGEAVEFQLMDIQGKVLTTETNNTVNSMVSHKLSLKTPLAAGVYYLKINQGDFNITKKVVIL
ncbi:MAG: M43 family zinc metalloprotease [Crocinitomicaceae bacterium]|nr:M43 family zinc metalloprotease [Crocinitomicaceae bacterium]